MFLKEHQLIKRAILSLLVAQGLFCSAKAISANELLLGKSAKAVAAIDIAIVQPVDLNFKSRAEILQMRKREVCKHMDLLRGTYVPSEEVFRQMTDKQPWWGILGEAFYSNGQNSIKGDSKESRFILNPFLLAGESFIPSIDHSLIDEKALFSRQFPMFFRPSGLRWWPKEGKAEVTYEITAYKREMSSRLNNTPVTVNPDLSLDLINARDFGLPYFYIPPSWAYNLGISNPMVGPMAIPQHIEGRGSCGYPGGCNNVQPTFAQLNDFSLTNLPARLVLMFWKHPPSTGKEKPDMIYTINYR